MGFWVESEWEDMTSGLVIWVHSISYLLIPALRYSDQSGHQKNNDDVADGECLLTFFVSGANCVSPSFTSDSGYFFWFMGEMS